MNDDPSLPPQSTFQHTDPIALRHRVRELEALLRANGIPLPPDAPLVAPPLVAPPPPIEQRAPTVELPQSPEIATDAVERFIGVKIAAVAGALAVLGAIGYFIKFAIDTGLFGRLAPEVKFGLSLALAALFLVVAELVRVRRGLDASIALYSAGVVSLFGAVFGGVFVLQLFGPMSAVLMVIGTALVGAAIAVRSTSAMVGVLALIGGLALGVVNGFDEGAVLSGIELTTVLLLAVMMTALGPLRFARIRDAALLGGTPILLAWSIESHASPIERAIFIVLWWGIFAGSCMFEAIRGRSAKDNAITLAAVSAAALIGSIGATGGGSDLSDPLAYLPLLIGAGLAVAAVQLRAIGEGSDDENAPGEDIVDSGAAACKMLGIAAFGAAPIALLTALGVFFDGAAIAIAAAGGAALLAFSTSRLRVYALIPACVITTLVAAIATFVEFLIGLFGGASARSMWPSETSSITGALRDLLALRFFTPQIGAAVAAVLLFLPLFFGTWPRLLASAMGATASLLVVLLMVTMFGPWMGSALCAALVFILVLLPQVTPRLTATPRMCLAILFAALGHFAWWGGAIYAWSVYPDGSVHHAWTALTAGISCAGLLVLRDLYAPERRLWIDGIVALTATAICSYIVCATVENANHDASFTIIALVLMMSACSMVIAAVARIVRSYGFGCVAFVPVTPSIFLILIVAATVLFAPIAHAGGFTLWWIAAAFVPLAAVLFARTMVRALGEANTSTPSTKRALLTLLLAMFVASSTVSISALCDGRPPAPVLIAILGLSAICFLYWGFKCAIAPARWVGLSLLALLAFRLIVVDLSQTATIVRVALLFAAGLVLVGTSIAYAMWKPKV